MKFSLTRLKWNTMLHLTYSLIINPAEDERATIDLININSDDYIEEEGIQPEDLCGCYLGRPNLRCVDSTYHDDNTNPEPGDLVIVSFRDVRTFGNNS